VLAQPFEETVRVGGQSGQAGDDERLHFEIAGGQRRLSLPLQGGRRSDSQGGIPVLATHGRIFAQVACHLQAWRA